MLIHMREPGGVIEKHYYVPMMCGVRVVLDDNVKVSYGHLPVDDPNYGPPQVGDVEPTCEACILLWFAHCSGEV